MTKIIKHRILLAEDNPDDALLTTMALEESPACHEIIHVVDGTLVLDYLFARGEYADRDTSELPGIIILDLNMPKMNGLEALKEIRANELTKRIPVVILTTSTHDEDIVQSYDLGANSYVRKPVDFDEFGELAKQLGLYWLVMNQSV